ncbi:hypothetical protein ACEN9F_16530 [Duganella sp. CT11-25]|jgi:hypothetical protein|uniref:hypothetical protein n=1 Tax=unclassified Duganella TaxID=2636909 RepID=UPI0039AF07A5
MKLNGIEIPDDMEIPELSADAIAEINELQEVNRRDHQRMREDRLERIRNGIYRAPPQTERPEDSQPLKISISTLRKLEPLARAKVLYAFRDQVTP